MRTLRAIRAAGARAGLGINPATPVEPFADLLPELDMLLLMTVDPGFGGQHFLDLVLPKIRRARAMLAASGLGEIWLQVDGGVGEETIERCAEAGADVFVAGSAVYGATDPAQAARNLREQAERATARAGWRHRLAGTAQPSAKHHRHRLPARVDRQRGVERGEPGHADLRRHAVAGASVPPTGSRSASQAARTARRWTR